VAWQDGSISLKLSTIQFRQPGADGRVSVTISGDDTHLLIMQCKVDGQNRRPVLSRPSSSILLSAEGSPHPSAESKWTTHSLPGSKDQVSSTGMPSHNSNKLKKDYFYVQFLIIIYSTSLFTLSRLAVKFPHAG
jgi:hypothetical protein